MLRFNVSGPYYVRFDTRSFFSSIGIVFLLGLEHETVTHIEVFLLKVPLHGQDFKQRARRGDKGQTCYLLIVLIKIMLMLLSALWGHSWLL